jgi:hypothetical protein
MSELLNIHVARLRPFHDLLMVLPTVATKDGALDMANTSQDALRRLAECADAVMLTANSGNAAMGKLIALCAADAEDGSFGADALEAVGWLIAELGELAALSATLAAASRKQLVEPLRIKPTRKPTSV